MFLYFALFCAILRYLVIFSGIWLSNGCKEGSQWKTCNARFRADIQNIKDDTKWYARVSTPELTRNGCQHIEPEQDRLFAERLVRAMKAVPWQPKMKELFSMARDTNMEMRIEEFKDSLAVCLHYQDFDDELFEVIDMLSDALNNLDSQTPRPGQQKGTQLGNALVSFPVGVKIVSEARLFLGKGRKTMEVFDATKVVIKGIEVCLGEVNVDITSNKICLTIGKCLHDAAVLATNVDTEVLPKFLPRLGEESFGPTLLQLCTLVSEAWKKIAGEILTGSATEGSCTDWLAATKVQRENLHLINFDVVKALVGKSEAMDPIIEMGLGLQKMCVALSSVTSARDSSEEMAMADVNALKKKMQEVFFSNPLLTNDPTSWVASGAFSWRSFKFVFSGSALHGISWPCTAMAIDLHWFSLIST